jgi:hypothetical protein
MIKLTRRQIEASTHAAVTAFVLPKVTAAAVTRAARDRVRWPVGAAIGLNAVEDLAGGHGAAKCMRRNHGLTRLRGDFADERDSVASGDFYLARRWLPNTRTEVSERLGRHDPLPACDGLVTGKMTGFQRAVDRGPGPTRDRAEIGNGVRLERITLRIAKRVQNWFHATLSSTNLVLSATFQSKEKSLPSSTAINRARSSSTHLSPDITRLKWLSESPSWVATHRKVRP